MFVKQLELFGFKTFAEKTCIDLGSGITAVVGPNGCGKSNIADALLWVLGESNVRNIRGQRNTDVIFNGSEKRRALGVAEVTLTLDNTSGTLPLSFSEVTVTRRAYRSGESEYFINKSRCRLKDIYELFLDTGIGREAYSMITQGEIDAILSAKPEDRRELFEEAAGVKKYRYRRHEALRKLEKTEANLNRVRDIMSEIGGQLEPLAEQAEDAKRYNELQARLREIEIGLLIRDLHRFSEALNEVRESRREADAEIQRCDTLLADLERESHEQVKALRQTEEQLEQERKVQASLAANVGRIESRAALLDERLRSAETARRRTLQEIEDIRRRLEDSRQRVRELKAERAACAETEQRLRADSQTMAQTVEQLDRQFEQASRSANDQKASYLELARELAARRSALQNSLDKIAQLTNLAAKQQARKSELDSQLRQALKTKDESAARAAEAGARIGELLEEVSGVQAATSECVEELAQIDRELSDIAQESASRSSRLATLREMAEAHEGFFEGVRSVVDANRAGKLAGSFRVVADVITVPAGLETAIETALGASVQDIITSSTVEARQAIAFLKQNRAGRATFLPLDAMRQSGRRAGIEPHPRAGVLGSAADLIQYNAADAPAIRSLLDGVVVVDNIDNAILASKRLADWRRIVTLEGELIVPSGAITGGAARKRGPGLLSRKQEMEALEKDVAQLEERSSRLAGKRDSLRARVEALRESAAAAEERIAADRAALADCERRADFAGREAERLSRELETVRLENEETQEALAREEETAAAIRLELEAGGQEDVDLDRRLAGAQEDIEELERRRNSARGELMRVNVDLSASAQRISSVNAALEEVSQAVEEQSSSLEARQAELDHIASESSALIEEREAAAAECRRQRELLAVAEAQLSAHFQSRAREMEKNSVIDARIRETNRTRNRLSQDAHEADVREARLEVQVNQAAQRLLEEYEITADQALAWPEEVEVERGTAAEVARLRREIREMGPVNTGAVQEYERIRERWDFLTEQRADLESARDQINAAIRDIDENTRGLFMETYNSVADSFERMFVRLFAGGKAELSLTDPNNLLETGINITVQPPGKKLQDMSLMSGGERALTATALVFALLMAKPSPFVVMDEVDAPLDESNVERFAEVLRDFARHSQFIVITHNRATMEASDSLYGVTMEEPGVSKIISVRLAAEGSAAAFDTPPEPQAEPLGAQS